LEWSAYATPGWFYTGLRTTGMRYSACRNLFYLAKGAMIGMAVILGLAIVIAPTQNKMEVK
jgi:hypothetical protein